MTLPTAKSSAMTIITTTGAHDDRGSGICCWARRTGSGITAARLVEEAHDAKAFASRLFKPCLEMTRVENA
jgi:hypothetical protein